MKDQQDGTSALNPWELGVAAVFFLIGLYMVFEGVRYGTGTITRIGPGFFPTSIGVLLMGLSLAVALEVRRSLAATPKISLRVALAIIIGMVAFALLINSAGLVPAIFAVVFISRFAEPSANIVNSAIIGAVLAILGWLVFIVGFNLPLKPFWW